MDTPLALAGVDDDADGSGGASVGVGVGDGRDQLAAPAVGLDLAVQDDHGGVGGSPPKPGARDDDDGRGGVHAGHTALDDEIDPEEL